MPGTPTASLRPSLATNRTSHRGWQSLHLCSINWRRRASLPGVQSTIILGFSQGACLALEYVARNARRYGGVVGLSGGLIGPEGTPRDYPDELSGTPVFLGCSDMDPHISKERVEQAAEVLRLLGGNVTTRLYPHMDHTVNQDELRFVQGMMASILPIGN